jgi:hypothetical protein
VCQSRPLDRWGVAGYYLRTCRELPHFLEFGDEKSVEAFYTFALTPATLITADVQIVGSARQLVNTAAILRARICYVRSLSQNFSPAGVKSPFFARAMPTETTSLIPASGR